VTEKDIIKKIRQEAQSHEPNLRSFIETRFSASIKKPFLAWLTLSLATLLMTFALIVVVLNNANINPSLSSSETTSTSSSTSIVSSSVINPPLPLADRQPLSIAVVSTTSLLPNITNGNEPAPILSRQGQITEEDFDQVIDEVSSYFPLVEQIISGQGAPVITSYTVIEGNPYFGQFTYVDMIESTDLTGALLNYEMYYNVLALNSTTPISDNNFRLRGMLLINDNAFGLIGSKTTDGYDIIFQFSSFLILGFDEDNLPILDEGNFVFSRYILSNEETRYRIIRFENGVAIQSTWMKIEIEDDKIKLVLELESNNRSSLFEFKYEQEDIDDEDQDDDEDDEEDSGYAKLEIKFKIEKAGEAALRGKIRLYLVQDELGNFVYRLRVTEGEFKDKEKDEDRDHK
jgi:uncharacterized membrane protein YkoI